jgi:hypothetical protein
MAFYWSTGSANCTICGTYWIARLANISGVLCESYKYAIGVGLTNSQFSKFLISILVFRDIHFEVIAVLFM